MSTAVQGTHSGCLTKIFLDGRWLDVYIDNGLTNGWMKGWMGGYMDDF